MNKMLFKLPWGVALSGNIRTRDITGRNEMVSNVAFRGDPVKYAKALVEANFGNALAALGMAERVHKGDLNNVFWTNVHNFLHNKVHGKTVRAPKQDAVVQ